MSSTKEVITIQVGGCGNNIAMELLYRMLSEHWLDNDGLFRNQTQSDDTSQIETRLNKIHTYFREINAQLFDGYIRSEIQQKYATLPYIPNDIKNIMKYFLLDGSHQAFYPRSILVDLDPSSLDHIKTSNIGHLFNENNFHSSTTSAGHNWAKGHYTDGAELVHQIVDSIRREAEQCDATQAFQLFHSLGGGTGSGLGTLLLLKIRDNYPACLNVTFSVVTRTSFAPEVMVEPYNQTLALHNMIQNADIAFLFDNEALHNISHNVLRLTAPTYADFNWIASMAMSGITSTLRLDARYNLNESWRRLGINMNPFPRLHFLPSSASPLFHREYQQKISLNIQELHDQMYAARNFMCNVRAADGKYLSVALVFRGDCPQKVVDDECAKIGCKMADDWVCWIPNNVKSTVVEVALDNTERSGTLLANTTAMKAVFQSISARFAKVYKRKAFLHWYKGEGMDEMEFQEAGENVNDLITEYQDKQDAVVHLGDESDDDEDEESEYESDYSETEDF